MTVLPRFLYHFQMIPLFLPKSFFQELNTHISSFIWHGSTPRAKRSLLEMPRSMGGLGLPNFTFYYWSANVAKLIYWISAFEHKRGPSWALLEVFPTSSISLLCSSLPIKTINNIKNPVIKDSLRIWSQFRKHFDFSAACSHMPLTDNHLFPTSLEDTGFQIWRYNGLIYFSDLFSEGTFVAFETLVQNHNLPRTHFFKYLQARSFARNHYSFPHITANILDEILEWDPATSGNIAKLYKLFQSSVASSLDKTKITWEQDLNIKIADKIWEGAIQRTHSRFCIDCISRKLNYLGSMQIQILHVSNVTKSLHRLVTCSMIAHL